MRFQRYAPIFVILLCASGYGAEKLFTADSEEQGAPFKLTVTETARFPTKSYVVVPNFDERTAAGSRWLMCAYTALAVERKFEYWTVVYPKNGQDKLVVGLTNNESDSAKDLLGSDYDPERLLVKDKPSSTALWAQLCGIEFKRTEA